MVTPAYFAAPRGAPCAQRIVAAARLILACVMCLIVASGIAQARVDAAGPAERPTRTARTAPSLKSLSCRIMGMEPIDDQPATGIVCRPPGEEKTTKILACLSVGMEAVMIPEAPGVVCVPPKVGGKFLDEKEAGPKRSDKKPQMYAHPHKLEFEKSCAKSVDPIVVDPRVLERDFIKRLVRQTENTKSDKKIDPNGIRIIGGIFCDGLDLVGLDLPFSVVLDRSIFISQVDVRNFRTKGDLAFDVAVLYAPLLINRAEISGTLWVQHAFIETLDISDTNIKGSARLDHSGVLDRLTIKNVSVEGDLDISTMFFSYLEVFRNDVDGVFDVSQSQARCSFDIRKNEFGDMVAAQLGFGVIEDRSTYDFGDVINSYIKMEADQNLRLVRSVAFGVGEFYAQNERLYTLSENMTAIERWFGLGTRPGEPSFYFAEVASKGTFGRPLPEGVGDPNGWFAAGATTGALMRAKEQCLALNSIKPGTFALVGNRIKSTLCVRSFNWLIDRGDAPRQSNIYLTENTISGATWLDIMQPNLIAYPTTPKDRDDVLPIFTILNLSTGTLVINFNVATQDVLLTVNGLRFERIYTSNARCESAMALRSGAARRFASQFPQEEISFPPNLELPKTKDIIAWIDKNKFAGTQQPFAAFVAVFEGAGDAEAARELKIRAANASVRSTLCGLLPASVRPGLRACSPALTERSGAQVTSDHAALDRIGEWASALVHWVEKAVVALINVILWLLADHGFRPERIGWFVAATILLFWLFIFPIWLRIVGYSIDGADGKVHMIGLGFFFDRMLPAYRIREENYRIKKYYVALRKGENRKGGLLSVRNVDFLVGEADDAEAAKAEWWLDVLKLLGFVFAVFILAAIGRLVR